ncbi:ABC transporter ATP-binding protein [Paenibacillus sp. 598K]|uniref:ABC transporter ATP-binding protein n=1 Tax=Paenibacillus sp. 598K TaxID=1117987 RepID=UPI001626F92C|nr:ABC transporter ATP-binding protein [Paenibacillus sp. 598K]
MKNMRRAFQTILSVYKLLWTWEPKIILLFIGLRIILAFVPGIQILITKELLENINGIIDNNLPVSAVFGILALQGAILLLAQLIKSIDRLVSSYYERIGKFHIDSMIAKKSTMLPLSFFDRSSSYDQLEKASSGQHAVNLLSLFFELVQSAITLTTLIIIVYSINPILAIGALFFLIPSLYVNFIYGQKRILLIREQTASQRLVLYLFSILTGKEAAKENRISNTFDYFKGKWSAAFKQNIKEQMKLEKRASFIAWSMESLSALYGVLILSYAVWLIHKGQVSIAEFVALMQIIMSYPSLVQSISSNISRIFETTLLVDDLFYYMSLPEEKDHNGPTAHIPKPLVKGIRIENLSFKYVNSQKAILNNISIDINSGEKVAIVGENGCGKTTLIKCLLGLYDLPDETIFYDDIDINSINKKHLRQRISVVFQDFMKYQLSAKENIALSDINKEIKDEEIRLAAKKAKASEFISQLQDSYETILGPQFLGGTELSYGQWQRIALSRAFYKNTDIIILDEPTSALDPIAEVDLHQEFLNVSEGKTTIFISHRLGSCKFADRIIVLKNGTVAEVGTHDELIKHQGLYYQMYNEQAKWYQVNEPSLSQV